MDNPIAGPSPDLESGDSDTTTSSTKIKRDMAASSSANLQATSGEGDGVRAVLARLGAASTNWHQATVFFLTSKAEQDAEMRAKAPLVYGAGLLMVLMQFLVSISIWVGMMMPTCMESSQCRSGSYCYTQGSSNRGRCMFCGSVPPLVPYWSPPGTEKTGYGPTGYEKQWNVVSSGLYAKEGFVRSADLIGFAGFNDTHVRAACTRPFQKFVISPS